MLKKKVLTIVAAVFVAVMLLNTSGCADNKDTVDTSRTVSPEQAKKTLQTIVDHAASHDIEKLCSFGASSLMTNRHLEDAGGWKSLPEDYPEITDTYIIEPQELDGSTALGGRILVLEGTTGTGNSYRTEFLVAFDPDSEKLVVPYPVYWSGIGIGELDDEGNGTTEKAVMDFGIYLAETNELVISGNDIASFSSFMNTFTLNGNGIEKWNAYHTYTDLPKLRETLFDQEFIIIIEDTELCRGKFWSFASSALYSGFIIMESLFKLEEGNATLRLENGSPPMDDDAFSKVSSQLADYFEKHGLLE